MKLCHVMAAKPVGELFHNAQFILISHLAIGFRKEKRVEHVLWPTEDQTG
jgi:hypothetical protein